MEPASGTRRSGSRHLWTSSPVRHLWVPIIPTVLPAEDRSLPHRGVPTSDEEPSYRSVLVVSVPDEDTGSPLQVRHEWKAQQKILWAVRTKIEKYKRKNTPKPHYILPLNRTHNSHSLRNHEASPNPTQGPYIYK